MFYRLFYTLARSVRNEGSNGGNDSEPDKGEDNTTPRSTENDLVRPRTLLHILTLQERNGRNGNETDLLNTIPPPSERTRRTMEPDDGTNAKETLGSKPERMGQMGQQHTLRLQDISQRNNRRHTILPDAWTRPRPTR